MRKLISIKLKELREVVNAQKLLFYLPSVCYFRETKKILSSASTETVLTVESTNSLEDELDISELFNIPNTFPDFEFNTLLQTTPMGNSILKYYATNECLDNAGRTRLVDIIVKHLYNYIIKKYVFCNKCIWNLQTFQSCTKLQATKKCKIDSF